MDLLEWTQRLRVCVSPVHMSRTVTAVDALRNPVEKHSIPKT